MRHSRKFFNCGARILIIAATSCGRLLYASEGVCQPDWVSTFGGQPGVSGGAVLTMLPDADGSSLYVGGMFNSAGGVAANRIAKWNGANWENLGAGMNNSVFALAVFDDGNGPALFAGGMFTQAGGIPAKGIAKWDGTAWSALGSGVAGTDAAVRALAVYDDGHGPALYAGGRFTTAGGVTVNHIAKWDGLNWSALENGMNHGVPTFVTALYVFNDGTGEALFAGGNFTSAGEVRAFNIAKWNGLAWSALGVGTTAGSSSGVHSIVAYDSGDGTGASLVAAGTFQNVFNTGGGLTVNNIAKWDGTNWSALGEGIGHASVAVVNGLAIFDDGNGPVLHVGGWFQRAGGNWIDNLATWDGREWSALGDGQYEFATVQSLATMNGQSNRSLLIGADSAFGTTPLRFDGQSLSGFGIGLNASVQALAAFDDGSGPALYAGGPFGFFGPSDVRYLAKWSQDHWIPVGDGFDTSVSSFCVFDDGNGPALYLGGPSGGGPPMFVMKWDGDQLTPVGGPFIGVFSAGINTLCVFDDGGGPALFVGGKFSSVDGIDVNNLAKWNGKAWLPVGQGANGVVSKLAVHDDGNGPALYVGGTFTMVGGISANRIAALRGSTWSALGAGMNNTVNAITSFDDGTGSALYAGGSFSNAGGVAAAGIAKWNGKTWSPVGGGITGGLSLIPVVYDLTGFDDGSGSALYACGHFLNAGGVPANHVAKWNGTSWSALGAGVAGSQNVRCEVLGAFEELPGPPALYMGGTFTVSPANDSFIAKWQGCVQSVPGDINGDGQVGVADLLAVINNWGPCVDPNSCPADVAPPGPPQGDDQVNVQDLLFIINNWG